MTGGYSPRNSPRGRSAARTTATRQIDDEGNQQDQAERPATNRGTTKVKPAAAKQEKQNQEYDYKVHARS